MSEVLNVQARDSGGTRVARRLRTNGLVPAVLYGHEQQNVYLAAPADAVRALIRHGSRVVDLQGAVTEKALVREVQWDAFGVEVLHLDFTRVSAGEKVRVEVPVELRGVAPGTKEGGVVEHILHSVDIECPVDQVPDKITMRIGELGLDQQRTVAQLEVPAGVVVLNDADEVVVLCSAASEEAETEAGAGPAEPELIGRKPAGEEGEEGEE